MFGPQWLQTEKTNKVAIHEQKIKCAYIQAEDGSTSANGIPEENEETATGGDSRMVDDSVSEAFVQAFSECELV